MGSARWQSAGLLRPGPAAHGYSEACMPSRIGVACGGQRAPEADQQRPKFPFPQSPPARTARACPSVSVRPTPIRVRATNRWVACRLLPLAGCGLRLASSFTVHPEQPRLRVQAPHLRLHSFKCSAVNTQPYSRRHSRQAPSESSPDIPGTNNVRAAAVPCNTSLLCTTTCTAPSYGARAPLPQDALHASLYMPPPTSDRHIVPARSVTAMTRES